MSFLEAVRAGSDTFDELRIIAKDARGLASDDRAVIVRAADELEHAWRTLVATQAQLIEQQHRRIAVNEQLITARQRIAYLSFYDPRAWTVHWKAS